MDRVAGLSPGRYGAPWTMVTPSGVAVVCDLDREVRLRAAEDFQAEVLAGEAYALSARAEPVTLQVFRLRLS